MGVAVSEGDGCDGVEDSLSANWEDGPGESVMT